MEEIQVDSSVWLKHELFLALAELTVGAPRYFRVLDITRMTQKHVVRMSKKILIHPGHGCPWLSLDSYLKNNGSQAQPGAN